MDRIEPELVLKTTPPRNQKGVQMRERLSIASPDLADRMAISLHAPAGFGKTLLLAQWRREFLSRGAVVGWLTLDGRDDSNRFVHGLAAAMALGSGRQSFATNSERMMVSARDGLDGLTDWLAEVADLGVETVLILDEADTLPDATAQYSLTYLLHNAPANLRVIMASRSRLRLRVADLLARGLYVALPADTLRFRVEETLAILTGRFGSRIEPDPCVHLHELTEGWPLGLQLAVAAIEKSANLVAAIDELSACSGDIQSYFVDSPVARLPAEQVEFLTCISLLDMVHPALCVALYGNERAGEMLHDLCESTPILAESLDSEWVRLHPLAREFLQARFSGFPLEYRHRLHVRAANWLEEQGFFEEAARHYLQAGQAEQAYRNIERCLYEVTLRGQFGRVKEWIDELPAEEVESRPRLCLAAAWVLALSDRHLEAARLIGLIQEDPAADEDMRSEASAIAAAAYYFADRPDESLRIATPWMDRLPNGSLKLRAMIANQVAVLLLLQGQPEKARRVFQRTPNYVWTPQLDAIRGLGEWVFGMTYLHEGRVLQAEAAFRDSLLRAEKDIGRRSSVAVILACGLAKALLERGEVQEATTVLANRLDVVERLASPDAIAMGFLTAARLAVLQGQAHRCHDLLEALCALGEERGIPRFCIVALGEQIRLHALQGRGDTCQALWRRLEERAPVSVRQGHGLLGPELCLAAGLARVYVHLAVRDWPTLLDELNAAHEIAERMRRGREVVQLKLLRALALKESRQDGVPSLKEALSLAEEYGLRRIVQDSHPDLVRWVEQIQRDSVAAVVEPTATIAATARQEALSMSVSPSRLLTPKEREVLQLLARNLSNKQIAQALNVGEETVKWHLKNLFGKFQAGTRKHVVDRAYMLGILESSG